MNGSRIRKGAALVAALMATVAVGCGGGDSPEDVVSATYEAAADGDAGAVCENLSSATLEAAEAEGGCEAALEPVLASAGALLGEVEVGEATIDGDTGTVAVTVAGQEDEVPVVQEDGEWKVDDEL